MTSKRVVLPAPLGPMKPTISPRRDRERHVVERGDAAEALRDVVDGEARASGSPVEPAVRRAWPSPRLAVGARRRPRRRRSRRALEEHRPQHVGPLEELGGRAVEADLALLHEVRGLGEREREVHRLLDEDDRRALLADGLHDRRAAGAMTVGASPSDSSSIISRRGREMNAIPSVSICCWPPERLPAGSCSRSRSTGK